MKNKIIAVFIASFLIVTGANILHITNSIINSDDRAIIELSTGKIDSLQYQDLK